ncbi:MAG: hypothetical protein FWE91_10805 [Defluviitaleaceae bacterium]|nr:hypothetical protein [Defluviitaleaceae bacterium]MCL2836327.1 hypothetical protein [Defluviitaleaceae bacterium]
MVGSAFYLESYINFNVSDEKMHKILEIYDFFYSEEGINLLMFGFEGEDYIIEDGYIVSLLGTDPNTGRLLNTSDKYAFVSGADAGFKSAVTWAADMVQYDDPTLSQALRDMAKAEKEYRIANWNPPPTDLRISAVTVPERTAMAGISIRNSWAQMITDTSDISDEDLFDQFYADWEANGYKAAKEAMTRRVAELGY